MTFHRKSDAAHQWQTWLRQHRTELLACNIPGILLESERSWLYFLDHGSYTLVGSAAPVLDVDCIPPSDAQRLCLFLEQDTYYSASTTLNQLQFLLKRGRHAKTSAQ